MWPMGRESARLRDWTAKRDLKTATPSMPSIRAAHMPTDSGPTVVPDAWGVRRRGGNGAAGGQYRHKEAILIPGGGLIQFFPILVANRPSAYWVARGVVALSRCLAVSLSRCCRQGQTTRAANCPLIPGSFRPLTAQSTSQILPPAPLLPLARGQGPCRFLPCYSMDSCCGLYMLYRCASEPEPEAY